VKEIEAASYEPDYSGYSNEVLYRMCAEQPSHSDVDIIESKLGLIGRAYAATMERKAKTDTGEKFNLHDAAHKVVKFGVELDRLISELRKIGRPEFENARILLSTHAWLTARFNDLTKLDKRSLASKYLHFHAPLSVFIFDSVAKRGLREKLPALLVDRKRPSLTSPEADKEYLTFTRDCLLFREEKERELGKSISARRLDSFLYKPDYIDRLQKSSADQSLRHKYWV
jgi:hypothetical protein